MLKNKQGGFTLLELLVVITLLALLSVGALVAYDGVGENASATAAANNMTTTDRTIRQYVAVTGNFPNQWDVLSDAVVATTPFDFISAADISADTTGDLEEAVIVSAATRKAFGGWDVEAATTGDVGAKVLQSLINYGIDELQYAGVATQGNLPSGVLPNTAHNEGANAGNTTWASGEAGEADTDEATTLSIFPAGGTCTAGGQPIAQSFDNSTGTLLEQVARINAINDYLEDETCNLILALGFGGDAAKSMQNSSVQMTAAPTFSSRTLNPANNYARFIGLFHMGSGAEAPGNLNIVDESQIFDKPRLIAILTPEGKSLDEVLAEATAAK
jgi:prepilin-type N-terminal cleavage/methylation domain-containing protein